MLYIFIINYLELRLVGINKTERFNKVIFQEIEIAREQKNTELRKIMYLWESDYITVRATVTF